MGEQKRITVVVAEPGKQPETRVVDNTLAALQALVGGYLECQPWGTYYIWMNEDGRRLSLPYNRLVADQMYLGTIFVAKTASGGDMVGLTEKEIGEVSLWLHLPGRLASGGGG
jgi:hypothetical protein